MIYFCVYFHCCMTEALGIWIHDSVEESGPREAVHSLCFLGFCWVFFFLEGNKKIILTPAVLGGYIHTGFGKSQVRILATLLCCLPVPQYWPPWLSLVFNHIFLFSSTFWWFSVCLKKRISIWYRGKVNVSQAVNTCLESVFSAPLKSVENLLVS